MSMQKILKSFADLRTGLVLVLVLSLESGIGIWMQAEYGIAVANKNIFHNWLCWPLALSFLVVYLVVLASIRSPWSRPYLGQKLVLWGGAVLLAGVGCANLFTETAFLNLGVNDLSLRAISASQWELALRTDDDEGSETESQDFDELLLGSAADLGEDASAIIVTQKLLYGAVGPGGKLVPVPSLAEDLTLPALQFHVDHEQVEHTLTTQDTSFAIDAHTTLILRHKGLNLPCAIKLLSISQETEPATGTPANMRSVVSYMEPSGLREATIRVNEPLHLGNTILLQSAIAHDQNNAERSVILVSTNPFSAVPLIGIVLMALGLLLHIGWKRPLRLSRMLRLLPLGLLMFALPVRAEVPQAFCHLPMLVDGRVRTLDTYARELLMQASGRTSAPHLDACTWLFHLTLDASTDSIPIFRINNPQTIALLGLPAQDAFSWKQLESLGEQLDSLVHRTDSLPAWKLGAQERALLQFDEAWMQVYFAKHSLDFLRPDSALSQISVAAATLAPHPLPASFLEFSLQSKPIKMVVDSLLQNPVGELTEAGQQYVAWVNAVLASADPWAELEFNILPKKDSLGLAWSSPAAEVLHTNLESPEARSQVLAWQQIFNAAQQNDSAALEQACNHLYSLTWPLVGQQGISVRQLWLDNIINRVRLMFWAMCLLALAIPFALVGLWKRLGWATSGAAVIAFAGVGLLGLDLVARALIAQRFPVVNFYEFLLAMTACASGMLLVLGHLRKSPLAPLTAAVLGLGMVVFASSMTINGASLSALAVALNARTWLSAHVLSMVLGFASLLASAALAHGHLWLQKFRKGSALERSTFVLENDLFRIGIGFLILGTLLGGLWAERVWGQFWNSDAKETATLLLLLWAAGLLLLQVKKRFSRRNFSLGILVVMQVATLTFLGIDLLAIGLHSFGFAEASFWGLLSFALAELSFGLWILKG